MMRRVILGIVLAWAAAPEASPQSQPLPKVYEAPDREPTPEETLILEYMNRFRANPSAEADLIAPPDKTPGGGVDWKMFREEMKSLKPMPPLVFSLELLDAARKHSYYMVHNGLTHTEESGKIGYTGNGPGDRVKAAGYKGGGGAENAFMGSGGPWDSHSGFLVDAGAGPGGMQPERGHRRNMIGDHREVGPGGVAHSKTRLSVTHNFGSRGVRAAGGVMYIDFNGNKFYDLGEGMGSVAVASSDGAQGASWKSGAYSLDLKGNGAVTLTATLDGEKLTKTFPGGGENVKFDWAIPVEVPLKKADRLLQAVEKAGEPDTPGHFKAVVALYLHTRGLYMDNERRLRVGQITLDIGAELQSHQKAVLVALEDLDDPGLQKTIEEHQKPYKGTEAEAWFEEAEQSARLRRGVAAFLKQGKSPQERRQMVAALEEAARKMRTVHFRSVVEALAGRVRTTASEGAAR